jgi:hypothetical protein
MKWKQVFILLWLLVSSIVRYGALSFSLGYSRSVILGKVRLNWVRS